MAIPGKNDLRRPVLQAIAEGVPERQALCSRMRDKFCLSAEEWEQRTSTGTRVLLPRVHWTIFDSVTAEFVRRPKRGVYVITDSRRKALATGPDLFDNAVLHGVPVFREWFERAILKQEDGQERARSAGTANSQGSKTNVDSDTPPERIDAARRAHDEALTEELIARLLEETPDFFEAAVIKLLQAMGYGRGREGAGRVIGKSGDGGIDGLIDEDALGLDRVYMQAKRYARENTIGRPAIQQFVGSRTGEGATKGVFVTTSSFSREAQAYAARVRQRVILIDGDRFARLMIAYGVGVRTVETVEIREIDENFFTED